MKFGLLVHHFEVIIYIIITIQKACVIVKTICLVYPKFIRELAQFMTRVLLSS